MYFATWKDFESWFEEQYTGLKLEEGATEQGPFIQPTAQPDEPPWKLEWRILFPDKKYIRVAESYYATPKRSGGGGYRKHFSFHYGDLKLDSNGKPLRDPVSYDIRIDCDMRDAHLHYDGEDHVPQSRVKGLEIEKQDVFDFVSKIQEHRKSKKPLTEIFRFSVDLAA